MYILAHVRESFVPWSGDAFVWTENSLPHGDEQGFHRANEVDICLGSKLAVNEDEDALKMNAEHTLAKRSLAAFV